MAKWMDWSSSVVEKEHMNLLIGIKAPLLGDTDQDRSVGYFTTSDYPHECQNCYFFSEVIMII